MTKHTTPKVRYVGLDHLRGIMALAVMLYHLLMWGNISLPWFLQKPLGLLGLYAVSTFYILSGAALYIVYRRRRLSWEFMTEFFVKRSFRIIPLFWFVTTLALWLDDFNKLSDDPLRVFLNYSLLFSLFDPSGYLTVGAWSIGNEWAFYLFFPIIIFSLHRLRSFFFVSIIFAVGSLAYSEIMLSQSIPLAVQWDNYVSPINQGVFFAIGPLVGFIILKVLSQKEVNCGVSWGKPIVLVCVALLIFVFVSWTTDTEETLSGPLKILLAGVCALWCLGAGLSRQSVGFLTWLGDHSYSIYLIHPIVFRILTTATTRLADRGGSVSSLSDLQIGLLVMTGSIVGTLITSAITYRFIEKPFMSVGKKLAARVKNGSMVKSP